MNEVVSVGRSGLRCSPIISGALWWLDAQSAAWSEGEWRSELDRQRGLGFDMLWLANVPGSIDLPGDPVARILDLCAVLGMEAILDTGSTAGWYERLDLEREAAFCRSCIERVAQRYGGHSAFRYWYVPHEIYACWGEMARYIDDLYPRLVSCCRAAVAIPVTLSPFFILDRNRVFGDYQYCEPDEYESYWGKLITRSGFDIIMLQDSGEHFSYVTNQQRKPFFEAMRNACERSGAKLWGNVECAEFECESIEAYERTYGRIHHCKVKDAPWRPVPVDRLKEKLYLAARYSERIVTWGYREYGRPELGPMSSRWFEDYHCYAESEARARREAPR